MIQEIFSFHQVENLDWNDFIESEENREAVACLSCWPKSWHSNGVIIYGAPKVGKTHIASLWAQTANAIYILKPAFSENPRNLFEVNCNFVIDNFDDLADIDINNWMFDFFNICREKNRFFLLISRTSPSIWNIKLKDLRSRLQTLPAINMRSPNDDLLLKIAKKLSKDFGIIVTDETLSYILDHIRRDVPSLSATLRMLDKIAMQKQKSITIPFVRNYICTEKDEEFR